mgnify:CR=1 FL=1
MTVLLTELKGSTLVLTMNRPEALNALSNELTAALLQEVRAASARREVRSIPIRANRPPHTVGLIAPYREPHTPVLDALIQMSRSMSDGD